MKPNILSLEDNVNWMLFTRKRMITLSIYNDFMAIRDFNQSRTGEC